MLKSRIPLIIAALDDAAIDGVKEAAEQIVETAKQRVPVVSGALRDAIHVETKGNEISVVAGDSDAWYGHIVENGSVSNPPRPFLIPALESEREQIERIVGEKLRDL